MPSNSKAAFPDPSSKVNSAFGVTSIFTECVSDPAGLVTVNEAVITPATPAYAYVGF